MYNFNYFGFARVLIFMAGLFLTATRAAGQEVFRVDGSEAATVIDGNAPPPPAYQINLILVSQNPNKYTIEASALSNGTVNIINTSENILFFVRLPDGNFISLNKYNTTGTIFTPYKREIFLQKTVVGTQDLFVNDMQAWAFKKNDPTTPPPYTSASGGITMLYNGARNGVITASTTGLNFVAPNYLNTNQALKLGTSWSPWDKSGAYYYLIVTYQSGTSAPSVNGTITVSKCIDRTGFSMMEYDQLTPSTSTTSNWDTAVSIGGGTSSFTYPFRDLKPGEVRQLYIKMNWIGTHTDTIAMYRAAITFGDEYRPITTPCDSIVLLTAPHDPNTKLVDQNACTGNGTGMLTYTITFQNEGNAAAKDVIITDQLPTQVYPGTATYLSSSHAHPIMSNSNNLVTFTFNDINLPGLAQVSPICSYDESTGWVKFSTIAACPSSGQTIKNDASIVFVTPGGFHLDPIITPLVIVSADTTVRPQWTMSPPCPPCPKKCKIYFCKWHPRWCICLCKCCRKPKTPKVIKTTKK